jgi:exopolyphosphatase/guanosine-5'-triphosphate,3'-diphosphate pyrophosphatase
MRLAAIDIGSNAIRLLIEEVISDGKQTIVRKISLTRVPLRLGADTFHKGKISTKTINKLIRTMEAFWKLMDVHEVVDFRACATSAMREASNCDLVKEIVRNRANIDIDVIDGTEEANLLFSNFKGRKNLSPDENYLFIDLGGGSTEITLIIDNERVSSKSFKIGTVRGLQGNIKKKYWEDLDAWVKENIPKDLDLIGIGTGGNINRLHKEAGLKSSEKLQLEALKELSDYLESHTLEERMLKLKLKPDRADVIVPAAQIYIRIMELSGVKEIKVPKVGLSDGIILNLYQNWMDRELNS